MTLLQMICSEVAHTGGGDGHSLTEHVYAIVSFC